MQQDRPSRPTRRDARKERRVSSKKVAPIVEVSEPEIAQADAPGEAPAPLPEPRTPLPARRTGRRARSSLRASLAVVGGRTAGALSRRLHLGGGTSIAGVVAQRLYPHIIEHLSTQLQQGSILVTGTNGKTTTSGFIAAILRDAGLRVWRNREGFILLLALACALVILTLPNVRLRRAPAIPRSRLEPSRLRQTRRPASLRIAAINPLVVVLPFVPVTRILPCCNWF